MPDQDTAIILLAEAAGGVMRHVIDLYKGLRQRGWQVHMVLSPLRIEPRYCEELAQFNPQDITYVPMRRAPHLADLRAYSAIASILKRALGKTILHAHSTKAGLIGALLHSQVIGSLYTPHSYRGVDPASPRMLNALLRSVERAYSKDYDRVITVSPAEMGYAEAIGINRKALRCIPNGLDISRVNFEEIFERRKLQRGRLCLGFVGRLVYQKNPLLFIEVLAEIVRRGHDAHAIIIGDGPLKTVMETLAGHYGIAGRIDWRGGIPASSSLPEMDVVVHTSVYEALPYTLIEACADMLPIVATSNYGSEAILRSRLPMNIASTPDANEIASIVLSIMNNEGYRMEQLRLLAEITRDYSTESMINRIEAEYLALAS
ncbi:Exopolysaccharide biosynthesis glycosyltransferase EpsF [Acidisarcina polymorpha]|uniref:Exopolysaccharide biosynthesis glycosyltransferase EpsF n=1 Tax=Acidisarcina polymorpha TaxID=2211140 RepID=A0A2Z5G1G6_9BACT|nr:glycosyltransferase [Acidisarcina polymorpha]AXC12941.1 Exopolysaccharide biosynthesis glycosyltransferase EpsF [Acidisarcina polymorpha]